MDIQKIVAGVDFSEHSEKAVAQAMRLARHLGAELALVHVGRVAEVGESRLAQYEQKLRPWVESDFLESRARLEELRERLLGQGVDVSKAMREGNPADALVESAQELDADLIVVGSHGHTGFKRFLLGSVAEKVIRISPMSVLVTRAMAFENGFRRILVPVDFDVDPDSAVQVAAKVADKVADKGADVDLFHCWHLPPGLTQAWGSRSSAVNEIRQAQTDRIDSRLNELLLKHRQEGIDLSFDRVEASARYGIQHRLESRDYDLVVIRSHGRTGLARWFVGSVASAATRHAPCSVLVVKPGQTNA